MLAVDGATVEGNRIYNCVSTNLFVSGSQNVTVNRNWIYATTDTYNRRDYGSRATGIQLANEGKNIGWSLNNIRITNNIIEWVSQVRALLEGAAQRAAGEGQLRQPLHRVQRLQSDPVLLSGS